MTLGQTLTGPEQDEIIELLATILRDVINGERSEQRAVAALRKAFGAAVNQNPNFMNELRAASRP